MSQCKHCDAGFCNGPLDDSCGYYVDKNTPEDVPHCPICGNECGQGDLDEYGAHVKCAMDQ